MLAMIDTTGNIVIYDAAGKNPIKVTTDAVPGSRVYQWPTWATDGRLAYFGASDDSADAYSLRVFVVDPFTAGSVPKIHTAFTSRTDTFTYAYWSPANCTSGANCRDLALLYTPADGSGLAVRLIREADGTFSDHILDHASPFYYSFAADGNRMLWFQNGDSLKLYDIASAKITQTLTDQPGQFQSPMWSPTDDRLLFGVRDPANAQLTDLVIAQGEKRTAIAQALPPPLSFAWSPSGTQVAYVSAFGQVTVIDDQRGVAIAQSKYTDTIGFFWAPQSDRIAYFTVNRPTAGVQARMRANGHTPVEQAVGGLTLHILDIKTGTDTSYASFIPSQTMIYLLNFYDQFAHSHRLWSPDGRYVTYASTDTIGQSGVYLADTRQADAATPVKIGTGVIGIWSY